MQQSQNQKGLKGKKRRLRLLFSVVFAFLLWGSFVYYQQGDEIQDSKKKAKDLQQQVQQLNGEKAELQKRVNQLQDKEYIAKLARQNFFYTKKGEVLFITPDDQPAKKQ